MRLPDSVSGLAADAGLLDPGSDIHKIQILFQRSQNKNPLQITNGAYALLRQHTRNQPVERDLPKFTCRISDEFLGKMSTTSRREKSHFAQKPGWLLCPAKHFF